MRDLCGRTISYLRISVTDRCNYRCRYCMPPDGVPDCGHAAVCSFEELCEMAEAAVRCGVTKLRVTGGEPLVRRGVVDFCRMLRGIDGVGELCLTTNGALLDALAEALRAAGVDRLNISLDTLRADRFRAITRTGTLADVLRGIDAAERAGFERIKLNCVLLGGVNDDEIADFVELTREKPFQIRFIERMPIGCGADFGAYLPASAVLEKCPSLTPIGTDGVAAVYRLPDGIGTVGLITPMSHDFCADCSRLRITADGRLKPCLHSGEELPLRGLHGDALVAAIEDGLRRKPARHQLAEETHSRAARAMYEIGG